MFKCVNALPRGCVAHPSATEIIRIGKKGDEKMTMIEMKKYDDTTTNEMSTVADRLPPLDEEEMQWATSHHYRQYAHGFMADHKDGQATFFHKLGVNFQRVDETMVRCVSVVDHPFCFTRLASMKVTFESAGIEVQLDPYTVVIPYEEPPEEEPQEEVVGVEVA